MPFMLERKNITRMNTDAIVNAANSLLAEGGGVCGAIFSAAGPRALAAACRPLSPVRTGDAVITPAFNLRAQFIIHAVGPVYHHHSEQEAERLLYKTYESSLNLARDNNCSSIAFPLISSGIYGFPKDKALAIAFRAIHDFLSENDMDVYLCVFDPASVALGRRLKGELEEYLAGHYAESDMDGSEDSCPSDVASDFYSCKLSSVSPAISDILESVSGNFSEDLISLIVRKGRTEIDVYRGANLDRKHFSKIRSGKNGYTPRKGTILALAISLELDMEETEDLLAKAGFAFSLHDKRDAVVQYFLEKRRYDIYEINQVLFNYNLTPLGV